MRRGGLAFLLKFVILAAAFYGFAWTTVYDTQVLPWVAGVQASVSAALLRWVGQPAVADGALVLGEGAARMVQLRIAKGCDASEAMALFLAGVVAFPVAWRARWRGVGLGLAVLFGLNVLRVVTLFLIARYARAWFHTAHVDLWPAMILFEALLLWAWWARDAQQGARPSPSVVPIGYGSAYRLPESLP